MGRASACSWSLSWPRMLLVECSAVINSCPLKIKIVPSNYPVLCLLSLALNFTVQCNPLYVCSLSWDPANQFMLKIFYSQVRTYYSHDILPIILYHVLIIPTLMKPQLYMNRCVCTRITACQIVEQHLRYQSLSLTMLHVPP